MEEARPVTRWQVRWPGLRTLGRICVLATAVGLPTQLAAVTRVFVQNNTSYSFSVSTQQSGASLAREHWRQATGLVAPGQRAEVVRFNRDEGITNRRDFDFRTTLSVGGNRMVLKQRLHGKPINSHMWQSLEGPGIADPWFDDRETHRATWRFGDRAIPIRYRAFAGGTDDDIEYVLRQIYTVTPGGPETLNVLAYNVYMRPTSLFRNGQEIRARLLAENLHGYDVLVFSEAFDDDARRILLQGLQSEYPHRTRILGADHGFEQDGGVIIVSRWPIEAQDQRPFGNLCSGTDCSADKGVLYARIAKGGRRYHVFGTHTQADPDARSAAIRRPQFQLIREFIDSKRIPATEAVIIAGDLNVDKRRARDEFRGMLRTLDAAHPRAAGPPYSFDPATNRLAADGRPEYLDYALYSNRNLRPVTASNEVRIIRSEEEWKEYFWEHALWDLSDHYALYGRFQFRR